VSAVSNEFFDWINESIDFGFERFNSGDYEPVIVLALESDERRVYELDNDNQTQEEDLAVGRGIIARIREGKFYALIRDGYVSSHEGDELDAIVVEAGQRGGASVVMAQAYEETEEDGIGKLGYVLFPSTTVNLWNEPHPGPASRTRKRAKKIQPHEIHTLEDLAFYATSFQLNQIQAGDSTVGFYLIDHEGEIHNVVSETEDGVFLPEMKDSAETFIADFDAGVMYAMTYLLHMMLDEVEQHVVVAEVGQRNGQALMYVRKFQLAETGKIARAGRPIVLKEIDHLWDTSEQPTEA
jgi:hypothetical protein